MINKDGSQYLQIHPAQLNPFYLIKYHRIKFHKADHKKPKTIHLLNERNLIRMFFKKKRKILTSTEIKYRLCRTDHSFIHSVLKTKR